MKFTSLKAGLMASTLIGGLSVAAPAMAQDGAGADETIVVTGSRIQRQDLTAPSPVTTVDAAQLQMNNTVNLEDFLNDLPQIVPALDASSNNPGNGTASISLRGLGSTRTLVLLDGTRMVGEGTGQVVNINVLPAALVEQVEIISGGASAVYGSDAIAGVVNFILKDDFEGWEVDASHRWTEQGGAHNTSISLTAGSNFADGRGNAVMSFSYNDRGSLLQGERDFSSITAVDNGSGTFGEGGSINIPGTSFFAPNFSGLGLNDPANPLYSRWTGAECDVRSGCWSFAVRVDENGEVQPFRSSGDNNDRYNYAPTNYLQLPQERYNFTSFLNYDLGGGHELKMRGIYSSAVVDSQLAPTPGGTQFNFEINADNPFLSSELAGVFAASSAINQGDTDGDGFDNYIFTTGRRYQEISTRNSLRDTNVFQLGTGIEGPFFGDFDYSVWGQYSRSQADQIQTGNVSISAVQAAVLEGRANIFGGPDSLQADIAEEISRTGAIFTTTEQTQIIGTLSGEFAQFKSPAADYPLSVVAGVEYREEFAKRQPDSVLGPDVMGFNQSTALEGRYDVAEFFGEFYLPLIDGMEFVDSLALNGGYRYSDYSTVGSVDSFFIGAEYAPIEDVRIRGQFQRAVRAPNIGNLVQTDSNGFPGVQDLCSDGSNGAWNALDSAQQAIVAANCIADGTPDPFTTSIPQLNSQVEAIFTGSSNLEAEEADTFTLGVVWTPSMIDGLSLTLDYFDIEIANALGGPTAQQVVNACMLAGSQAACDITQRGGNGALTLLGLRDGSQSLSTENQTGLFVEGFDYAISYFFAPDWDYGDFAFQLNGTHYETNSFQPTANLPVAECAGFYGGDCGEPTPEDKFLASGTWMYGNFSLTARTTWISEVTDYQSTVLGLYSQGLDVSSIDSFNYWDFNASYDVNDQVTLYGGIRNAFEQDPPQLGDGPQSEQANTWPATYDPYGRQFFLGLTVRG